MSPLFQLSQTSSIWVKQSWTLQNNSVSSSIASSNPRRCHKEQNCPNSWIAKWWVNASNTGKDRLRWLVPRSVCYFSTDLFLISLHLRFLIWQLVSLFLMGKAWSPLFLEELWAVGLSLVALSRARLISMQPLWPQITQHSLDWKEKQQLWGTLWKSTEDFAKGRRKSPRWQKEVIARNCSGASGHLAYNFWSAQHRFKPLKAVLPGFCFIRV